MSNASGLYNRPVRIGSAESRRITRTLAAHHELMVALQAAGMDAKAASALAFQELTNLPVPGGKK